MNEENYKRENVVDGGAIIQQQYECAIIFFGKR